MIKLFKIISKLYKRDEEIPLLRDIIEKQSIIESLEKQLKETLEENYNLGLLLQNRDRTNQELLIRLESLNDYIKNQRESIYKIITKKR